MLALLVGLQAIQVAILWLHDWIPLGNLNDVAAAQAHDTRGRLIRVTLIQSVPFTIGLVASIAYAETGRPTWLWNWLWISYIILFAGELRAWWWPYLVRPEPGGRRATEPCSIGPALSCQNATAWSPTLCIRCCISRRPLL